MIVRRFAMVAVIAICMNGCGANRAVKGAAIGAGEGSPIASNDGRAAGRRVELVIVPNEEAGAK